MTAQLHKRSYDLFVKPYLKWYLKRPRTFTYRQLRLNIQPGVFHPGFFFSTRIFADYIGQLDFKDKKVCEVGAGSGLLSFIAYAKGAKVCSFDINPVAVKSMHENFKKNFGQAPGFEAHFSNLFDSVPQHRFDVLLINPPYFFKAAENAAAMAWYCGPNGEYFEKLFAQLGRHSHAASQVLMILADNCDLERIAAIAAKYQRRITKIYEQKKKWETNFIFSVEPVSPGEE